MSLTDSDGSTYQEECSQAGYVPIRDYAIIGDCHGAALISRNGSVDWCCLGRFDADPVFCHLLDAQKGGLLSVCPEGDYTSERAYLGATNILRTTFSTASGSVAVMDFMPVGRAPSAGIHDYVTLNAPFWLVRRVEGITGTAQLRIRYRPMPDFARRCVRLAALPGQILAEGGPALHTDITLSINADRAEGLIEVRAGEHRYLIVAWQSINDEPHLAKRIDTLFKITRAFWEEWAAYCRYRGPYREAVLRSALVLKLLTYAPSGAIVAAPTTSLPEEIGGERNWDYRYCWLRDATFILYALAELGYSGEARRFARFLYTSCKATHPRVQIMYGIHGETELTEQILDHFAGYCGSQPVRTGNAAFAQQQLDVYGEVLDWALLYRTLSGRFTRADRRFLRSLAEYVLTHWQEPDEGIWEMRGPPRHHVYSKIMSWVALDRVIRLFGESNTLVQAREAILRSVLEHGLDPEQGYLRQAFDEPALDAALLLAAAVGFPLDQPTLTRTVDAIIQRLGRGDYLLRYDTYQTDDGLPRSEGAFLICSFWLVDALLFTGRAEAACALYERLLTCANDVGLYAEEIQPESHAFLGNFPQAFTHLALIHSAAILDLYDREGLAGLRGTHADRARRAVEAVAGLRALWAAFKKTGRVGRWKSSRASLLL